MRGVIFGVGLLLSTNSQIWAQSITVFEGSGFRGQDRSFQGPIPSLGNQGWSDRIGSFVIGGVRQEPAEVEVSLEAQRSSQRL